MKRTVFGVLAIMIVVVFATAGLYAQQATTQKQIAIEEKVEQPVEELQDIKNPEAEFKVELWTDREDAKYQVGDEIMFFFKTNRDCRLTLFNVGTSGKVHVIFPNKHQEDNLVKAGTVYQIPSEEAQWVFKAQAPAGVDLVKAIATLEKVDLVAQTDTEPAGEVQEITKPQSQVAKDIAIALKPVETNRWAEAEKVLEVMK